MDRMHRGSLLCTGPGNDKSVSLVSIRRVVLLHGAILHTIYINGYFTNYKIVSSLCSVPHFLHRLALVPAGSERPSQPQRPLCASVPVAEPQPGKLRWRCCTALRRCKVLIGSLGQWSKTLVKNR